MSSKFSCANCGFFPEIEPRLFSFNSPYGACQTCNGLGTKYFEDWTLVRIVKARDCARRAECILDDTNKINIVDITDLTIQKAKRVFC